MTEILTESFCERCGTRYTFESVQQRARPLGRLGTFGRGLKNFVVMDDASFDEAMAVARSEDESRATTAQLEAFHRTFNFCLTCRQYTCAECWNAVEGRCLTCAPMPLEEVLEAPAAFSAAAAALLAPAPAIEPPPVMRPAPRPAIEVEPLPVLELPVLELPVLDLPETEPQEPEPDEFEVPEALVAEPESEVAEPVSERSPEPEVAAASIEVEPETVAAVELQPAQAQAEAVPEAVPEIAAALDVEREREPEALPVEAQERVAEPVTEPTAPVSTPPAPSPFPGFHAGRSLDDEIAAYELRIAALASPLATPEPPIQAATFVHREPPSASTPGVVAAGAGMADVGTAAAVERPAGALMPGTCRSCGLSISASARFCRRCGARQDN